MVVLNATETVRTLKERISNATGIHQCFIKVYDGDILYEDDRLLFEIKGSDINFRLETSVSVHIVDENGVVHQSKHLVNEYDKTVEDMRKDLDESKRFTKGRQYLKFLVNEEQGINSSDRLLSIDNNVDIRFHVKMEKLFNRRSFFKK